MDAQGEIDVSRLTDRDKQELQQFIVNETQKSKIQQCTHSPYVSPPCLRLILLHSELCAALLNGPKDRSSWA